MHKQIMLLGLLTLACSETDVAPVPQRAGLSPDELSNLACGERLTGIVEATEVGKNFDINQYRYDLDVDGDAFMVDALDANGVVMYQLTSEIWLDDPITGRALVTLTDDAGAELLVSRGRAALEPGLGWHVETVRTVGEQTVSLRALVTPESQLNRFTLSTAAEDGAPNDGSLRPGRNGKAERALDLYDADGQAIVDLEGAKAWAESAGVSDALAGDFDQIKTAILEDPAWRLQAMQQLQWCRSDAKTRTEILLTAGAPVTPRSNIVSHSQALTCKEEALVLETQKNLSATLDFLSKHSGKLALGGPVGYLIDNSGDLNVNVTIDAGRYGKVTITKGELNIIRDYVKGAFAGGALAVAIANPVGVALAGAGAAMYIAARVNDAFGAEIMRAALERRKRSAQNAGGEAVSRGNRSRASSVGDPRLITHDGLRYDFQSTGEFWLVRPLDGGLGVQARQAAYRSRCEGAISVTTAVVVHFDGHIVQVGMGGITTIDGLLADRDGPGYPLAGGGEVAFEEAAGVIVRSADGDIVRISTRVRLVNLYVDLSESRMGNVEGILGDFDGDTENDLRLPNGRFLSSPLAFEDVYGIYADGWRITDVEESWFTYADGEGPETVYQADFPTNGFRIEDVPNEDRAAHAARCEGAGIMDPGLLEDCVVELHCTAEDESLDNEGHLADLADREDPIDNATIRPPGAPDPCGENVRTGEFEIGDLLNFDCPGNCEDSAVWGTDVYTDDSAVCIAAIHVGEIDRATGGAVTIELTDGQDNYEGTERNGVSSSNWGAYGRSYIFR